MSRLAAILAVLLPLAASTLGQTPATRRDGLAEYRRSLDRLRAEFGRVRPLPDVPFFLFGMGDRRKLVYQGGRLWDVRTGQTVRQWTLRLERIVPPEYAVDLHTADGRELRIEEDAQAVWLCDGPRREPIAAGTHRLQLPTFAGHRHAPVLRVLHQELLVNTVAAGPVPNLFVYRKPWYRDAALVAMALVQTGNVDVLRPWILGLREPFDGNNGNQEPDNLGQALYLVSLVSDRSHPLVGRILAELPRFTEGRHLKGKTDGAEHPVYQTAWLKLGLRSLGLDDRYELPDVPDSYAALCWWARPDRPRQARRSGPSDNYPYLTWAQDHYFGTKTGPLGNRDYPLTWEARASQADYPALRPLSAELAQLKLSPPHTWHAAEMFLYLTE